MGDVSEVMSTPKENEMSLNDAVNSVLQNLSSSASTSYLEPESHVLSMPIDDSSEMELVDDRGRDLAQNALQKTLNSYEQLVGSPQKLS